MSISAGFIGGGNIVDAMLAGIAASGAYCNEEIGIYDISEKVCDRYRIKGYTIFPSIEDLVKLSSIVVIAVTPQVIGEVIGPIKNTAANDTVFLSLAAGISTGWYREQIGDTCEIARCMPTLTAQTGLGTFALSGAEAISDSARADIYRLLSCCGVVEEIPESLMCEVVPLTGSAPAFFYRMTHVVVDEAVKMGFDEQTALRLFAQTMKGSAETLLHSGIRPQDLERRLHLSGGTTLAALDKMEECGFEVSLREGIGACTERCRELGAQP